MKGYVPIDRRIAERPEDGGCPLWGEARELSRWEAWVWLLLRASPERRVWQGAGLEVELHVLETPPLAVRQLARSWQWSKSRVQRHLAELMRMGRLEIGRQTAQGTTYRVAPEHGIYLLGPEGPQNGPWDSQRDSQMIENTGTRPTLWDSQRDTRREGAEKDDFARDGQRDSQSAENKRDSPPSWDSERDTPWDSQRDSQVIEKTGTRPTPWDSQRDTPAKEGLRGEPPWDSQRDSQAAENNELAGSRGTPPGTGAEKMRNSLREEGSREERREEKKEESREEAKASCRDPDADPPKTRKLTPQQDAVRRILETFERHGARPPRRPPAFARKLKEYRQALGEDRGLDALLADLDALGPKLHRGSSYALKVLANLLEQGRAGRLAATTRRRSRPRGPNPFQPEDA